MLKRSPNHRLIIEWTIATTTGVLIALASLFVVTENDAPKVRLFLFMIMPFWLAIAQGVVLRRYISNACSWIMATILGVCAAIPTIVIVYFATTWISYNRAAYTPSPNTQLPMTWEASIIATLVGGVVLALFQSLVLCRYNTRIGWWIALNSIVWAASSSWIIEVTVHFLNRGLDNWRKPYGYDYDLTQEMWITLMILITLIVSAIRGSMLVWLFKSPIDDQGMRD